MFKLISRLAAQIIPLLVLPSFALAAGPVADHHQHLFSPATIALINAGPSGPQVIDADALLVHLDRAGIRRAAVFSVAYMLGRPSRVIEDEYAKVRAWISLQRPYGEAQARAFLEQLMPLAPDIVVQVAHFAGAGPGYEDAPANEVMRVFAEAAARGDPHARRVWFDVASIVTPAISADHAREMARRIRLVGVERILFGSDAITPGNMAPREAWAAFRALPLTRGEFDAIAANLAPYLK